MKQIVLTPVAEADLAEIVEYVRRDSASAALRVLEALEDAMQLLAERPGIGHLRADLTGDAFLFWPVLSYLVIYRPDTDPLQIVRVLRGKRDVRRLLEE